MKPYTLTNREGESISPMTSTKTVFDANGTDLETLLSEQQQAIDDGLGACAKKTEVAQGLAAKQDALSDSADITVSADNKLSLTEKAKYATFDAQWTAAGGTVITPGKTYECNGGTGDLADAIKALSYNAGQIRANLSFMCFGQELKMLPTIIISCNAKVDMNQAFASLRGCKKIVLKSNTSSKIICGDVLFAFNSSFVEEIDGQLDVSRATNLHTMFSYCRTIKEVRLYGINDNVAFKEAQYLSLASLQYLVDNATNTKPITLTVHADVFAKLTDEANTEWHDVAVAALAKNITIATT